MLRLNDGLLKLSGISNLNFFASFECDDINAIFLEATNTMTRLSENISVVKPHNTTAYYLNNSIKELSNISISKKKDNISSIKTVYNSVRAVIDKEKDKREQINFDFLNFFKHNIRNWSTDISFGHKFVLDTEINNLFIDSK